MAERAAIIRSHFLLLPYVQQGHINPMLSLAFQLAALGCKVTFVKAEKDAAYNTSWVGNSAVEDQINTNPEKSCSLQRKYDAGGVVFVSLEANYKQLPSNTEETSKLEVCKSALAGLEERMQALAAEMVESSRSSTNPISCIICDFFMWRWVADLARGKGVRASVLWTSNMISLYVLFLEHKRKEVEMEEVLASRDLGLPRKEVDGAARYGLMGTRDTPQMRHQTLSFLDGMLAGIEEAGLHILVNSCTALEGAIDEAVAPLVAEACIVSGGNLAVSLVGPLLPAAAGTSAAGAAPPAISDGPSKRTASSGEEVVQKLGDEAGEGAEYNCLQWLDEQIRESGSTLRSVVYVSLIGSEEGMEVGQGQAEEIAAGIDDSGFNLLWVARPDAPTGSRPPEAFRERMERSGRGMFVAWAPQARVLQHPAVGAFVTHNGWNSTLEGLRAGVPMVCLPMLGDQPLNAFLVHTVLQTGLRPAASGSCVPRAHVESAVRALMQPGGGFSQRASQLRQALLIDDAAARSLASFVTQLAP